MGAAVAPLVVDAYAAQHPGDSSPQATQSVACHLVTLAAILDGSARLSDAVGLRKKVVALGRAGDGFPKLNPPLTWPMTIRTVTDAPDAPSRGPIVDGWIRSVLTAWRTQHSDTIEQWTSATLEM